MNGFFMSPRVMPVAKNRLRCGARSTPAFTWSETIFIFFLLLLGFFFQICSIHTRRRM